MGARVLGHATKDSYITELLHYVIMSSASLFGHEYDSPWTRAGELCNAVSKVAPSQYVSFLRLQRFSLHGGGHILRVSEYHIY